MLLAALAIPALVPRVGPAAPVAAEPLPDPSLVLTATIEAPLTAPAPVNRPAESVVVAPGATVETLAAQHHTDAAALRWANLIPDGTNPAPGSVVLIPPGPGALVRTADGERPSHFAARLGIDPRVLLDYNALTEDVPRPPGSYLQVPLGSGPAGALVGTDFAPSASGEPAVLLSAANHGDDRFPYGQCTYYVATKRDVPWNGNANQWWAAARGIRPEGQVPIAGAILVMDTGWAGHVLYVEHVNPDGSFLVSEMNYYGAPGGGWGRVDERTLTGSEPGIMGFIY